jgi:hypothetical protein
MYVVAGSTIVTPLSMCARLIRRRSVRQVDARVDADELIGIGADDGGDRAAVRQGGFGQIGQEIFALVRVGAHAAQRVPHPRAVEAIEADVDLLDRQLFGRAVHFLDDGAHRAVRVAGDAAESARVGRDERGQRHRGAGRTPRVQHRLHGLGADQRHVGVHDDDVAGAGGGGFGHAHGVSGAELLGLQRHVAAAGQHAAQVCGLGVHHHDRRRGGGALRLRQTMFDERSAGQRMQHFRRPRFHARTFARGEDHHPRRRKLGVVVCHFGKTRMQNRE